MNNQESGNRLGGNLPGVTIRLGSPQIPQGIVDLRRIGDNSQGNDELAEMLASVVEMTSEIEKMTFETLRAANIQKEDIEAYYSETGQKGGKDQITAEYLMKNVKGFSIQPPKKSTKLSPLVRKTIDFFGNGVSKYLIVAEKAAEALNSDKLVEMILCENQLGNLTVRYEQGKYYFKSLKYQDAREYVIEAANTGIIVTEEIAAVLKDILNYQRIETCSAASLATSYAFVASKVISKDKEGRPLSIVDRVVPKELANIEGMRNGKFENTMCDTIARSMEKIRPVMRTPEEITEVVVRLTTKIATVKGLVAKMTARMPTKFAEPNLKGNESIDTLMVKMDAIMPPFLKLASRIDSGSSRVSSNLKFVPCLTYLYGSLYPKDIPQAIFMGSAGLVHMRAVCHYFDVTDRCYDLIPTMLKENKYDPRMGAYKIIKADFFAHGYTEANILIDDVYDRAMHGKGGTDEGLHKKASCLLNFMMYTHSEQNLVVGRPLGLRRIKIEGQDYETEGLTRVMVKGRLPQEKYLSLYQDAYPFIACKTSEKTSREVYFVKWNNKDATRQSYINVTQQWTQAGSKQIQFFCRVIESEKDFRNYIRNHLRVCVKACFMIDQLIIMNPTLRLTLGNNRDWLLPSEVLPVTYVSQKSQSAGTVAFKGLRVTYEQATHSAGQVMDEIFKELEAAEGEMGGGEFTIHRVADHLGTDLKDPEGNEIPDDYGEEEAVTEALKDVDVVKDVDFSVK